MKTIKILAGISAVLFLIGTIAMYRPCPVCGSHLVFQNKTVTESKGLTHYQYRCTSGDVIQETFKNDVFLYANPDSEKIQHMREELVARSEQKSW
jgi:hypothetical protein